MLSRYWIMCLSAAISLAFAIGSAFGQPRYSHTGSTLISGIRVIDGLGFEVQSNQDILIQDGKIAAMGASGTLRAPDGALKIDGQGLTAMPGLMDLHIHLQGGWANGLIPGERYEVRFDDKSVQQRLSGYLYSGVTTVLDTGADHNWVLKKRDEINSGKLFGPRFFTTGVAWSSQPSGWDAGNTGGDATWARSTIVSDLSKLPEQVARYKKDGIEIIKIYAGIGTVGMQALIAEAHKQGIRAIADLWMLNLNREVMQTTGLDGWAHTGGFNVAPIEDHRWMAENNRFVIGTTVLGDAMSALRVGREHGKRLMAKDPLIVDIWGDDEVNHFYDVYGKIRHAYYDGPDSFYQRNNFGRLMRFRGNMMQNMKLSHEAGVLIACGTDDIYAGLWPGESTHREMELLVEAGIPELQAIKACTFNGAKVLEREKEFGSLQTGLSADLVLVEGDPSTNISHTRNIRHVFLKGKQIDRTSLKLKP